MLKSFQQIISDTLAMMCVILVSLVVALVGLIYLGPKAVYMGAKFIRELYYEITGV